MTGTHDSPSARPISVAELLAKNGTIGSPPVTGRRRRRRHNSDAVTVAELTGEIPVVRGDEGHESLPTTEAQGAARLAEPVPEQRDGDHSETVNWAEPQPRWPESLPPHSPQREPSPAQSQYPRPVRKADRIDTERRDGPESGAEQMSPDPVDNYADIPVDVMDTEVSDVELPTDDSAYVRSYLSGSETIFRGRRDAPAESGQAPPPAADEDDADIETDLAGGIEDEAPTIAQMLLRGGLIVLQSILAVAFGGGLFIAFDQLWKWNNIVALVLSVLVILGLVAGVRVVRRTEDIASTLIAVAVGALVTLAPLALMQSN